MLIPAIAACVVFLISYAAMEKSTPAPVLAAKEEKKEVKQVKAKSKKKKTIKKKTYMGAAKPETVSESADENEAEETAGSHNSTMMNILTSKISNYAIENNMSTEYCFLVDMSLPSGRNRFFIYDLQKGSVIYTGLVAHGSCNETFLARPKFSNQERTGCSSLGKYKVGEFYVGKYGKSFRLHGLDNCNSNAYKRAVVIHGYDCVPDKEIYPRVLCNSLGCVMVSYNFFDKVAKVIRKTNKPIVLWVYQ